MSFRSRICAALIAMAVLVPMAHGGALVQFACSMSGEVSTSCCCVSTVEDGCPSLERSCQCCEVKVVQGGEAAAPLTVHVSAPHIAHIQVAVLSYQTNIADVGVVVVRQEPIRAQSAPAYIRHGTLLL